MKKSLFVFASCSLLLFTVFCSAQDEPLQNELEIVQVKANTEVLNLVKTWDSEIWFFTSKSNPLKTLIGLKKDEVSCFGAENISKVLSLLDAAGIKYENRGVRIMGTGNAIYSGMENPPKLFITWSKFAPELDGAARITFVK